jgi:hypothetical protein
MRSSEALGSADTVMPDASGLELDHVTVVLLFEGPRFAEYSAEKAKELANAHLAYTIGLVSGGHLLHAGALVDHESGPKLTGMGLSRLTRQQLRPMIEKDPSVAAGLEGFRFVTHAFPRGSLVFPAEGFQKASSPANPKPRTTRLDTPTN